MHKRVTYRRVMYKGVTCRRITHTRGPHQLNRPPTTMKATMMMEILGATDGRLWATS